MNKRYLSLRDEEIMAVLWHNGPMTIRELQNIFRVKLHFNTLSTHIKGLEKHGFVKHNNESYRPYVYEALITEEEYLGRIIERLKTIYNRTILQRITFI